MAENNTPKTVNDKFPGHVGEDLPATSALSQDQFDRIVELLTPGYELSKLYLADYQARQSGDIETQD